MMSLVLQPLKFAQCTYCVVTYVNSFVKERVSEDVLCTSHAKQIRHIAFVKFSILLRQWMRTSGAAPSVLEATVQLAPKLPSVQEKPKFLNIPTYLTEIFRLQNACMVLD